MQQEILFTGAQGLLLPDLGLGPQEISLQQMVQFRLGEPPLNILMFVLKIGSFTIDMTTASGTQAVTGLGFSPKSLHFTAAVDGGTWLSHGLDDGTTHIGWSYIVASSSNNSNYWNTTSINNYDGAGVTMYQGYVSSLDADGFTITWTKTGSPTGVMRIFYHAFR